MLFEDENKHRRKISEIDKKDTGDESRDNIDNYLEDLRPDNQRITEENEDDYDSDNDKNSSNNMRARKSLVSDNTPKSSPT